MSEPAIHPGVRTETYEGRVDADAAIAYALATNDPNPVYPEGRAVPPMYTVSLILPAMGESGRLGVDPGAIKDVRGGVHGEHDVYFHAPIVPGSSVRWYSENHCAMQTPAGVLVSQRILVSDLEDRPLVEHFWTSMHIGGKIPADVGPRLADHTFPPSARAHPIGAERFQVSGDQTFRYAGASTDHASIHVDDEAARRNGFPSKFLQGLCTFGMCSGAVVKHAAGGDPDRLHRLAGRFSSPVFPRNELLVELYDAGSTAEGRPAFAFEATSAGQTVIKNGWVELNR